MKFLSVLAASASLANADLLYSSGDNVVTVDNFTNGAMPRLPGTEGISGNVSRTIMYEVRMADDTRKPMNFMECGENGLPGAGFAAGAWFGGGDVPEAINKGVSENGLTCHTGSGCYNDPVGGSSKRIQYDRKWHNVAHVWDGTTHKLYWDGQLFSEGADRNGELNTSPLGCVLGSLDDRFPFKGQLNNVEIWDEEKTQQYINNYYYQQAAKKIHWRLSNHINTSARPAPTEVRAYSDSQCSEPVQITLTDCLGGNCSAAFDGDSNTSWTAPCQTSQAPGGSGCSRGEAWLEFYSSEEIQCVETDNYNKLDILRNGVNFPLAYGVASLENKISWNRTFTGIKDGLCNRSIGACTGTGSLSNELVGSVFHEEQCLEKCFAAGVSGCEASYNMSTKLVDCYRVLGSVDGSDQTTSNKACYVLDDCSFPMDQMSAWFRGEDAKDGEWVSSIGTHSASISGSDTLSAYSESGFNGSSEVKGATGTRNTLVDFGYIVGPKNGDADWTICFASRYLGTQNRRIMQAEGNWLMGHWSSQTRKYHPYNNNWRTPAVQINYSHYALRNEWIPQCYTNKSPYFVMDGINMSRGQTTKSHPGKVNINRTYTNERSDFAVTEVMGWTRKMKVAEMVRVTNYIREKLDQKIDSKGYRTPNLVHKSVSETESRLGLSCDAVPEVTFENVWSNIDGNHHVDFDDEGKINFQGTGSGDITILLVERENLTFTNEGKLTESNEGVEIFIGGAGEPVIHVSSCLGCKPVEASIKPTANPLFQPRVYTDVVLTISGRTISISANNEEVYSFESAGNIIADQAIFTYGYGDLDCLPGSE